MSESATEQRSYEASASDVAAVYGVSSRTVMRWVERQEIPHRMTPSGPRFNLEEVDACFHPDNTVGDHKP